MYWKVFALTVILFQAGTVRAGEEVTGGRTLFESTCSECHYEDDFAGKSQAEILNEIKQFATVERKHKIDLSKLSENEMADVAAFFASFK